MSIASAISVVGRPRSCEASRTEPEIATYKLNTLAVTFARVRVRPANMVSGQPDRWRKMSVVWDMILDIYRIVIR